MASDLRLKEALPSLTARIVETYTTVGKINHIGHCPLPNSDVIVECCEDLKEIIYPGYRRREGLHLGNVTYHVGELIDGLHDKLTQQIARALRHEAGDGRRAERTPAAGLTGAKAPASNASDVPCDGDYEAKAQAIAITFLERLPEIRQMLALDAQAAFDGDPAVERIDEVIFCYPGLEAVTIYRLAHELYQMKIPFIPRMMAEWAHSRTGIDIHPGARIGTHFFIDHGTGVVIGQTCVIGNHVKIYQGVTLGALSFQMDEDGQLLRGDNVRRHPTIEDRVVIYASATVLGGLTVIGHDSVIGSSVWLTRSVPPQTTVVLEKPKLRMRSEQNDELKAEANFQI